MRTRISWSSCFRISSGSPLPQTGGAVHGVDVIPISSPTDASPAVSGCDCADPRSAAPERERCRTQSSPSAAITSSGDSRPASFFETKGLVDEGVEGDHMVAGVTGLSAHSLWRLKRLGVYKMLSSMCGV